MVGSVGIKRKVAQIYNNIHEKHEPTRDQSTSKLTNLLLRDINIPENPTTLDIGCGTGYSTFELEKQCNHKGTFYGIDISPKSITKAVQEAENRGRTNINFQIGDAEQLRFPESSFDLVISNMCFQFIPDKKRALTEVFKVLKPGGVVAFLYPGRQQYHEARELLLEVAEHYEDNPEVLLAVRENDRLLVDLVESKWLFRSAGFIDSVVYGIHQISYVEPDWFIESLSGTWGLWKSGLSSCLVDMVHSDLLVETEKMASRDGFKLTSYLIHATGKKIQHPNQ
jgi:ubiquinone/menaquinone biosynthesis C-methylase UbiE